MFACLAAAITMARRNAALHREQKIDAWARAMVQEDHNLVARAYADEEDSARTAAAEVAGEVSDKLDDDIDAAPVAAAMKPAAPADFDSDAPPTGEWVETMPVPSQPFRYSDRNLAQEADKLKASEISDVMQLAEAWMSFHHPYKVLEILEPFKEVEQPESPIPWICLLDVHRVMGDREKFDAIHKRIKKIFNVKMPGWDSRFGDEPIKTLADFPHIVDRIFTLWDTDEIVPYLDGLLHDRRDGEREGFDLPVYRNILQLISLASEPNPAKRRNHMTHGRAYDILFCPPVPSTDPSEAPRPEVEEREVHEARVNHDARVNLVSPPELRETVESALQDAPGLALVSSGAALEVETPSRPEAASLDSEGEMSAISIKLHLAMAYQDIGDSEGARILIEEVVKSGNPEQVLKARLLQTKL
jgi:pilus assembly protein FimV